MCHVRDFVECKKREVYRVPLSCGSFHTEQMGICADMRLWENLAFLQCNPPGHFAVHCSRCECTSDFEGTDLLALRSNALTGVITGVHVIIKPGSVSVSCPWH